MAVGKGVGSCGCKDKSNCPQCCTRCFRGELLAGNPEAAEIGIRGINFDIGIQPPPCCAGLNGEHHLAWDAATGTWKDGYYSIALECSEDCDDNGGTITPNCTEAGGPWTYDGEKWTGSSEGMNGFGCLQAGENESGGLVMHYGTTLEGQVDTYGSAVTLNTPPTYGDVILNSNGSFAYTPAIPDSQTLQFDSFSYDLDEEHGGGLFGSPPIMIYPQPQIDVWQSKNVTPIPPCCPDQIPPYPPGPYPPVPPPAGWSCCSDFPGALLLLPKACYGSISIYVCGTSCGSSLGVSNPHSFAGCGGCPPVVLSFDHFSMTGYAIYTGSVPNAFGCHDPQHLNPTLSLALGCSIDGPWIGFSSIYYGQQGGSFGCDLSKSYDAWFFGINYGYSNCPAEDFGCMNCLKGITGAPDSDCWIYLGGRGRYGAPCSGGRVDSAGTIIMALK